MVNATRRSTRIATQGVDETIYQEIRSDVDLSSDDLEVEDEKASSLFSLHVLFGNCLVASGAFTE